MYIYDQFLICVPVHTDHHRDHSHLLLWHAASQFISNKTPPSNHSLNTAPKGKTK